MPVIDLNNGWKAFSEAMASTMEEGVHDFLKKNSHSVNSDLFIVTGPAGVGKSSFIKSITLEDVYIGSTLKSGTMTTSLVPAVIGEKRCLFLDMPGFNTRDFNDWDIFVRLMTGLSAVREYVQFRGVIYVDSMVENRVTDAASKILNWLAHFCGESYMPNVTIVTTNWSGLNPRGAEEKLARVEMWKELDLLRPFFDNGAHIYHHGLDTRHGEYKTLDKDDYAVRRGMLAAEMIAERYGGPSSLTLKIYTEIANGAALDTTSAGRWLRYGTSTPPSQGSADAGASPTGNDGSSPRNDQQRQNQQGQRQQQQQQQQQGAPSEPTPSWTNQLATFYKEAKPWIGLLSTAARFYMSPSPGAVWELFSDDFPGVVEVAVSMFAVIFKIMVATA
ncbi:hypothetical protein BJY01DRAFT_240383 [Aspergillus pseudoustus]|uniref:G domain-containing protein n=1 Tax=Aspergillus pseudoustus TaxID=1810923 RepID=A0ABR4IRL5_9EURO